MNAPVTQLDDKRKPRPSVGDGLLITDEELYVRLGLSAADARPVIAILDQDRKSGFPQKQPLWKNRRYWPAVKAWFDHTLGLKLRVPKREPDND